MGVNEATRSLDFSPQFYSEHDGRFHETPIIRLHPSKGDDETSSGGDCTWHLTLIHVVLTELQDGNENPFTRLPHSDRYHKILGARKKLPVYAQMGDFYEIVSSALPFAREGAIEPFIPGRSCN